MTMKLGCSQTPLIHHLFSSCGVCHYLTQARWLVAGPLQVHLVRAWTVGHCLMLLPLIVWLWQGLHHVRHLSEEATDASGELAVYALLVVYFTSNKTHSFFSLILGIPYDQLIWYHGVAAVVAIVLTFFHVQIVLDISADDLFTTLFADRHNTVGSIAALSMLLLVLSSSFRVALRKFGYQLWYLLHCVGGIVAVVTLVLHDAEIMVFVGAWWALDWLLRLTMAMRRVKAKTQVLGKDIVEFRFPKAMEYAAGQFVLVCIPKASSLEFHPISISSAPHEDEMTIHVNATAGDWTSKLLELPNEVPICIQGPYSALHVNLTHYDSFVFVAGGVGITPLQSLAKELLFTGQANYILFVWVTRNQYLEDPLEAVTISSTTPLPATVAIYHSRGRDATDIYAPLSHIEHHDGRPDMDIILQNVKEQCKGKPVAVLGCGPEKLMTSMTQACRKNSNLCGGTVFDYHVESFEM